MNNTGQCCVAAKRFIVVDALADRFLAKFKAALAALEPGDPMDPATTLGPGDVLCRCSMWWRSASRSAVRSSARDSFRMPVISLLGAGSKATQVC